MEYPTVRQLAEYLEKGSAADDTEKLESSAAKRREMMKKRMEKRSNG